LKVFFLTLLLVFIFTCSDARGQDKTTRVFVDDKEVVLPMPVRRVAGDILVPLEPVCQGLGNQVSIDPIKNQITITRIQDGSIVIYNTASGDTTINSLPANSAKSLIPVMCAPGQVYLPLDILAYLLGVAVAPGEDRIDFNKQTLESAEVVKPTISWKDRGVDFLDYGLAEDTVKLNPSLSGGATRYGVVQSILAGGGGHIGPLTIRTNNKVQGGSGRNFLTFNSAHFQIRHNAAKWRFDGGDAPLSGFFSRQINGYPARGGLFVKEGKKYQFAAFQGAAFTKGVPVGGGTVRLSYQRYLSANDFTYRPNDKVSLNLGTIFFTDQSKFVQNTRQYGCYATFNSAYKTDRTTLNAEYWLGNGRRTPEHQGYAYLVDAWGQFKVNRRLSLYGEIDRINPNFAHPQIGNAFVNRQDLVVGVNMQPIKSIRINLNGSFNQSGLDLPKPSSTRIVNGSLSWSPFKKGPNFNFLGSQIFFRPSVGGTGTSSSAAPANTSLAAMTIDHNIMGAQVITGVTTTVGSSQGSPENVSNSVNISASRSIPRLGQLQFMSQIGHFISRGTNKSFDIRAIYTTLPIFNRLTLAFGPGYSKAADHDRWTFIAGLGTNIPYIGDYQMNVNRQLALTTSQGRLSKIFRLNGGRGGTEMGLIDTGKPPPFGAVTGYVLESAVFPVKDPAHKPKLEGLTIMLDDQPGIARTTGRDGKWSFDTIPVGRHKVSVMLSSAPATLAITSPANYYVIVAPGQVSTLNFALAKMATISGKITLAEDAKEYKDSLTSVRVLLAGKDFDTLSASDGSFSITDVPPGTYTVEVDPAFLHEALIVEPKSREVTLGSGVNLAMEDFKFKLKPRDVQRKKF
jgi:hypothetical protein